MNKIEAIIRPEELNQVRESLESRGFNGITVIEGRGRGCQKGLSLRWKAGSYQVELLPELKLEMVVDDQDIEAVVRSVLGSDYPGLADGKIFVCPVTEVASAGDEEDRGAAG